MNLRKTTPPFCLCRTNTDWICCTVQPFLGTRQSISLEHPTRSPNHTHVVFVEKDISTRIVAPFSDLPKCRNRVHSQGGARPLMHTVPTWFNFSDHMWQGEHATIMFVLIREEQKSKPGRGLPYLASRRIQNSKFQKQNTIKQISLLKP